MNTNAGLTLIELILTCGILLILSAAAIPMFRMTIQHRKESELRYDLREMRNAIDRYKDDADKNLIRTEVGSQNYPPDLQTLVDGVTDQRRWRRRGRDQRFGAGRSEQHSTVRIGRDAATGRRTGNGWRFAIWPRRDRWRLGWHSVAFIGRHGAPGHVRLDQQGALSAENSGRSDDRKSRLGLARRAG